MNPINLLITLTDRISIEFMFLQKGENGILLIVPKGVSVAVLINGIITSILYSLISDRYMCVLSNIILFQFNIGMWNVKEVALS